MGLAFLIGLENHGSRRDFDLLSFIILFLKGSNRCTTCLCDF
jgi:hypothetical protein